MKVKNAVIAVENLDESARFYTDILGMKETRRFSPQPGLTIAFLQGEGEAAIELIKGEEGEKGLYMVGMEVEDMDAELANLKARGVKLTRGPFSAQGGQGLPFWMARMVWKLN